jgi:hypothetical protein
MNESYYERKELLVKLQIARESIELLERRGEIAMDNDKLTPTEKALIRKSWQLRQVDIIDEALSLIQE